MQKALTIGWKVSALTEKVASVRYRAVLPMLALEQQNIRNHIFSAASSENIKDVDVLVFVKSLRVEDLAFAMLAARRGIPIVFDLCDNIFVNEYKGKSPISPASIFQMMSDLITSVVVSTEPLAEAVRKKTGNRLPVFVVPDGIETPDLTHDVIRRIRSASLGESKTIQIVRGRLVSLLAVAREQFRSRSARALIVHSLRTLKHRGSQSAGRSSRKIARFLRQQSKLWDQRLRRFQHKAQRYAQPRYWLKKLYRIYDFGRSSILGLPRRSPVAVGRVVPKVDIPVAGEIQNNPSKASLGSHQILWFGQHGAPHAKFGMLDLLGIRDSLERIAAELPVELVVVSNDFQKYLKFIKPMAISSRYAEWNPHAMLKHLEVADVVIVPNSRDEFSLCKSANRTAMALTAGVPVVATRTSALNSLRDCVEFDDFYGGLMRYLTDPLHARDHVEKGSTLVKVLFGQRTIGDRWSYVIANALETKKDKELNSAELIVVLHLVQDIDLAVPILQAASDGGVSVVIWCSVSFITRWPYVTTTLKELGIPWQVLPDNLKGLGNPFPLTTQALVTIAETNLNPHRFPHELTKLARIANIPTHTLQHGFENVGLTYTDGIQPIRNVEFASDRIFVWGPLSLLHSEISSRTRNKCVPVGCPKPAFAASALVPVTALSGKTVIGIFENLHWQRYSEDYRVFFLNGVRHLVERFPAITFALKPHNAGLWLTGRYTGEIPRSPNLLIIDPSSKDWLGLTTAQLMSCINAVITSPSTVALDSARANIPVAVVAHDLPLDNYFPLIQLKQINDWELFVEATLDSVLRRTQCKLGDDFVKRVIVPGNAAQTIVDELKIRNSS
jgi:glycosyltransferase involved in cell wall biosynthesis